MWYQKTLHWKKKTIHLPLSRSTIRTEPTKTFLAPTFFKPLDESKWYQPGPKQRTSATTSAQESYQTAQSELNPFELTQQGELIEIDKPTIEPERPLFEHLTQNIEDKSETSINVTMVQPTVDVPMGPQPLKLKELKLSPPKFFSGEREDLDGFLSDICL